ncbi:MAG: DNA/RNA helicases, SNF2 family, partial [uncultured Chloroflexia bacterium]
MGYFNLWGWKLVDDLVDDLEGTEESRVRLLVGMHSSPAEEVKAALSLQPEDGTVDHSRANQMRKRVAEDFRNQLLVGAPSNQSEAALRRLRDQLLSGKLVVKLHLSMQLHAKLYLFERDDAHVPKIGYVGSSNLTLAGIQKQAELNIDVLDQDATVKLSEWFERRWNERYSLDITKELAQILDESWINEKLIDPYLIYLKIAYHLSSEARAGVSEFSLPKVFEDKLFDFQAAAVKIAAHHLNRRGGVMIGDVVGLGKTLLSTALARVFEDDYGAETLIICPKNLTKMWESYRTTYGLRGQVLSMSKVQRELPNMRRYRLVLIDESHNLRNREGKKYRAIREYIERNDSKCIL